MNIEQALEEVELHDMDKKNENFLEDIDYALSYWNYNTKDKLHHITLGFAKAMLFTWEKYASLKITLKGTRQKIKKLMRNILKRLHIYQEENEVFLSRILFTARSLKPHNGCRSSKKGRRKVKRRKQRLKYKYKIYQKRYEFKQRLLTYEAKWHRKIARSYSIPLSEHLTRDMVMRKVSRTMKHKRDLSYFANFGTNVLNPAYKISYYYKPYNTKPKLSLFKFKKRQDLSEHFVKQLPNLSKDAETLNKTIKFYRRSIK